MLKIHRSIINTKNKKEVFNNVASLSVLQAANLILPLITFPYLVRILGIEKYGLLMFAQAFMAYFSLLVDYGFGLTGSREISNYKNNSTKIIQIYNSILMARVVLSVAGFIIMTSIVFVFNKFNVDWKLYLISYGIVIGNAFFPSWFFQGIEKMKYITILTVSSKMITTLLVFLLIRNTQDYLWVALLNTFSSLFIGISALIIINKEFKVPFRLQRKTRIFQQLRKGWFVFVSKIATNLYTATNTVVLGLVTNTTMVGYYVIAEKIIRTITSLFIPFTQAIYPKIIQLHNNAPEKAVALIRKIIKYVFVITLLMWLFSFLFAEDIFNVIFGEDVSKSIQIFRILSPLVIILPIAVVLFNLTLLPFNLDKHFFKIYLTGAILNTILLLIFLFVFNLSIIGAALSLLVCEVMITVYAGLILMRKGIDLFGVKKLDLNR